VVLATRVRDPLKFYLSYWKWTIMGKQMALADCRALRLKVAAGGAVGDLKKNFPPEHSCNPYSKDGAYEARYGWNFLEWLALIPNLQSRLLLNAGASSCVEGGRNLRSGRGGAGTVPAARTPGLNHFEFNNSGLSNSGLSSSGLSTSELSALRRSRARYPDTDPCAASFGEGEWESLQEILDLHDIVGSTDAFDHTLIALQSLTNWTDDETLYVLDRPSYRYLAHVYNKTAVCVTFITVLLTSPDKVYGHLALLSLVE